MTKRLPITALLLTAALTPLAAHAQTSTQVAPETHPVGDIPDNQAFVRYASAAGGYSLEVPEGWARAVSGTRVTFTSKLGAVEVWTAGSTGTPTPASVRSGELAALAKTVPGLKVTAVKAVTLPSGPAVRASFTSTGPVNAVTGRAPALENDLYVLSHAGKRVLLRFSAPLGSDNVDAWKQMSDSLRWR
ncbi:hypothetical protein HNQ07_003972 [Deinococcus metalli]|uniref:Lipoprotein n=1 Tax=Deinococcus metalli TaxID=1141878 RepID=A0A7W8KIF0_9DEIO|nr:hypothetical protein [Deinococcus metalli]MBB5378465.1 hypothetical protein [Deinococcus metalli]GHF57917.1 lipoprotein [Deinococcus metalli]